jgi:transposase
VSRRERFHKVAGQAHVLNNIDQLQGDKMTFTCGIDWAESHHDVALVDETGTRLALQRIKTNAEGFVELLELIAIHGGSPETVPVAIETDKNLIVVALMAAGFTVYPINPRAAARYRERHRQAGGKSDAVDATVLANVLRTDREFHRAMPSHSEEVLAVRVLTRQHQEAIWARQQTVNRLRSVLLEFYPTALAAFPNLTHRAALTVLAAAPTPGKGAKLSRARVVSLLRKSGRGNRAGLADQIIADLKTPRLSQPSKVEQALGHAVQGLIGIIEAMQVSIISLESAMTDAFVEHHHAQLFESVPGLGPVTGARILAEIGDDRDRFKTAQGLRSFAGTAPITRASGRSKVVSARHVHNKRLADACHWWAFNSLPRSGGARAHYDHRRAIGDSHNAALRNVANKLLGRL